MQTAGIGNIADFVKVCFSQDYIFANGSLIGRTQANPLAADCDAVFSVFCDPATYVAATPPWKDILAESKVHGISNFAFS